MDRWWLAEGVMVQVSGDTWYGEILESGIWFGETFMDFDEADFEKLKPRGVPFDCMPEWADQVSFCIDGNTFFSAKNNDYRIEGRCFPFPKCPKAWKGKTFKITDELRRLIG